MKQFFYLSFMTLALIATSCSGSNENSSGTNNQQSSSVMSVASDQGTPSAASADIAIQPSAKAENAKTPAKPETETDKLFKQANEALTALLIASKNGEKVDPKAFLELKEKIEALDKQGKLSDTHKELYKVMSDAYNRIKQ